MTARTYLGVLLRDFPLYAVSLFGGGDSWLAVRNRAERLDPAPNGSGYRCDWQWTSDLHAPKVFPGLGLRLMKRAFEDRPIVFQDAPIPNTDDIRISFIIGHRGPERLPHLLATLKSIAAQRDVAAECIVVEQSAAPEIERAIPDWVRYIHTPLPYPDMPYCRSWAFNVGARAARGRMLVLHDNDMLVPRDYASEIMKHFKEGYEVINLKRFIFYLTESHSGRIFYSGKPELDQSPQAIVQNLEAGGSLAVCRMAYFEIGGFDESFIGWGGEDNEFWERAQTRKVWPYGYLPIIHLLHTPQVEKIRPERATSALFLERSKLQVGTRIKELAVADFGNPLRPAGMDKQPVKR